MGTNKSTMKLYAAPGGGATSTITDTIQCRNSFETCQPSSLSTNLARIPKLTDAIGVLNGLSEAQKLLQGSKPSFASSGLLHQPAVFVSENNDCIP